MRYLCAIIFIQFLNHNYPKLSIMDFFNDY